MNIFTMIRQTKDPKNKKILEVLPPHECITYHLYFHERVKQRHIAKFMHVTQGGVSHRLKKSMKRLKYAYFIPKLTSEEKIYARRLLGSQMYDMCMFRAETTNQTITAEMINKKYKLRGNDRLNQVKVRYRYNKIIKKLEEYLTAIDMGTLKEHKIIHEQGVKPKIESLLKLLKYVGRNDYALHWVKLPQFKKIVRIPKNKKLTKEYVLNRLGHKR